VAVDRGLAGVHGRAPCNGCAERFIRTLKEQCIWARTYPDVAELRAAVAEFVERYNSGCSSSATGTAHPARRTGPGSGPGSRWRDAGTPMPTPPPNGPLRGSCGLVLDGIGDIDHVRPLARDPGSALRSVTQHRHVSKVPGPVQHLLNRPSRG